MDIGHRKEPVNCVELVSSNLVPSFMNIEGEQLYINSSYCFKLNMQRMMYQTMLTYLHKISKDSSNWLRSQEVIVNTD